MLYTNHSCDPNLAIQGQIVLVAMREIAAGEELTNRLGHTDDGDHEMACRCGSPRCRGTVTGKDWMKPELQRATAAGSAGSSSGRSRRPDSR